jgi:hypothetical protein
LADLSFASLIYPNLEFWRIVLNLRQAHVQKRTFEKPKQRPGGWQRLGSKQNGSHGITKFLSGISGKNPLNGQIALLARLSSGTVGQFNEKKFFHQPPLSSRSSVQTRRRKGRGGYKSSICHIVSTTSFTFTVTRWVTSFNAQ